MKISTDLKNTVGRFFLNSKGVSSARKVIVIESDDWGAIRMPNLQTYQKLSNSGYAVDKCPYAVNDSLASEEDLKKLFEVLSSFKDKSGNPPVITGNCVTANPDFHKIQESDFQSYFWEPITETFKKYDAHAKSFDLWKSGLEQKFFYPQFHGREHVNWKYWLKELRNPDSAHRKIFPLSTWTLKATESGANKINLQAALDTENYSDLEHHKSVSQRRGRLI